MLVLTLLKIKKFHLLLIAGSGYGLKKWLVSPYNDANLYVDKRRFNRELSKYISSIENAFGLQKVRLRCLLKRLHNTWNSLWLTFINTWMAYLLISWMTSWNSEKKPTIWEIITYLFESQNPRTKKFGLKSIAFRTSQLWKNVPEEIM